MINIHIKENIETLLNKTFNSNVSVLNALYVSGGCINTAANVETNVGNYFVKWNAASKYPAMFQKEAKGLQLLKNAHSLYIPEVIAVDNSNNTSFLVLEYIESAKTFDNFWEDFGSSLAVLHQNSNKDFGLDHDNYIGSLPQYNKPHADWVSFFIEQRLERQIKLALDNGKMDKAYINRFNVLYSQLGSIFPAEPPALLHGDLWNGNYMHAPNGNACLIDPAVYYGHREMDIAMTQLFGGFSTDFYNAYNNKYPMEKGWQQRMDICNLYPLMVHLNLFGEGYWGQIKVILNKFSTI